MIASKPTNLLALSLAAAALIVAGCGGDDSDSELTKQEFIEQSDEICTEANAELSQQAQEQFGAEGGEPPRAEQERFISEVVAPALQTQLEQIQQLSPPEEDSEQIDELLAALERLAERSADEPAAVLEGQEVEASELAAAYGFQVCGG